MKSKVLTLVIAASLSTALPLGAQCGGGGLLCVPIDVWIVNELPSCSIGAYCSTDWDFFDPYGNGGAVAICDGGVGTGTCTAGSGSHQGEGGVYCANRDENNVVIEEWVSDCC